VIANGIQAKGAPSDSRLTGSRSDYAPRRFPWLDEKLRLRHEKAGGQRLPALQEHDAAKGRLRPD